ncbi:site-specific DNA-methyltransferase [Nitrosopumilus sp.]|nr:site-specific DNA-methyltransferase [Nitrosopumilus sp.]
MTKSLDSKLDEIIDKVGKPYFKSKNTLLYNMDCSEFLETLNSKNIDLTITSPPYNIGKEYEKKSKNEDYLQWCEKWLNQIYQSTSAFGSFWLNLGYFEMAKKGKCVPISYLLWDKTPFYLMQEIVWYYKAGVTAKKYFAPRNEKYMWYVKNPDRYTFNLDDVRDKNVKYPNQKKNGKLKCNPLGKNPGNVWDIPKVTSGKNRASVERVDHPAQFPLEILDRIIKASSTKSDLIFDPFMGSGSVAISSIQNNRMVVGCEINKTYLELAKNRIKNYN